MTADDKLCYLGDIYLVTRSGEERAERGGLAHPGGETRDCGIMSKSPCVSEAPSSPGTLIHT